MIKTHDIDFRIAFQILISTSGGIKGAFDPLTSLTYSVPEPAGKGAVTVKAQLHTAKSSLLY